MASKNRTITVAALATLGACAFLFSFIAMMPSFLASWSGERSADGITYTFESFRCLTSVSAGDVCVWSGTVRDDGEVVEANVEYRGDADGVNAGDVVPALWSVHDPQVAWSASSDQAWLGTAASMIVSAILFLALAWIAITFWRRALPGTTVTEKSPEKTTTP